MEQRHEDIDSLATVIRSQREEIQKYRWIESEKVGCDIGFERAEQEWRRQHARGWRTWLRKQGLVHPTVDVIWSQQEEIEAFKWLESEQRGYDIGWEHAVREWSQKHYEAWRRHIVRDSGPAFPQNEPTLRSRQRSHRPEHRSNLSAPMKAWRMRRKAGQN
jgi:hypothetical protein